jgi:uncharacterized protein
MPTVEQARSWYEEHDPVHGFDHAMRVYALAEELGTEMNADLDVLRAAALLHDASGAAPGEGGTRGSHEQVSANFARRVLLDEGWEEAKIAAVEHCIRTHRFRNQESPQTLEAKILFDADKLDVVGAFGVARTIGYAIQAKTPIFSEPSEQFMIDGSKEPDEKHSAYHEYLFKLRRVKDRLYTEPAKRIASHRHKVLVQFFDQLAAEARRGR